MTRFAPWRRALGIAVAGISMITASAALAATTVNIWCWDTNFNGAAMREAAARYNKDHPDVTINIDVSMSQDDIRQKLQTQLLANNTQGLPDIVLIQDDVAQKYLQSFPGAFVPLGDSIDLSQFAQYMVAAATHDGKAYSLPFDSGVTGLFYRTDYLDQAGYKADDLQDIDWDKLIEIGKNVKAKTGHNLFGLDLN
ncbi:MAG: ABC transporter substrate-binding protein, partial [Devosia sp.]